MGDKDAVVENAVETAEETLQKLELIQAGKGELVDGETLEEDEENA